MSNKEKDTDFVSCLRDEIVVVRFIPKVVGFITNPKHVFYGGMSDNVARSFTVPKRYQTRTYVDVLTDEERVYLEASMGLEKGSLNVYRKENNFWSNFTVRLTKSDTRLNLNNPSDYIKYKVLLANNDLICPSLTALRDRPKRTYQFVLVTENAEIEESNKNFTESQKAWKNFGKIEDDIDKCKYIVEIVNGKKLSSKTKQALITAEINKVLQSNPKLFNDIVEDPYIESTILITKAVEEGIITKKGDFHYYESEALCDKGEDPILSYAAKYIDHPKNQTIKLSIQAKLK